VSILIWVISGFVTSVITSKVVNESGRNRAVNIILGVTGAVLGGWIFEGAGLTEGPRLSINSLVVAVICSIAALVAYHFLFRVAARDTRID